MVMIQALDKQLIGNRGGYSSLYCLKAIGAFFVVFIHFGWNIFPVIRTAVPFFFMISGFFLYQEDRKAAIEKCKKALIKALWIMLYANAFYYFILWLPNRPIPFDNLDSLLSLFQGGIRFHLWYFSAYIEVLVIMIIALYLRKERWLWYAAPIFVVFGMISGSYNFFMPLVSNDIMLNRNFLTIGIPCFTAGWLMKHYEDKLNQYAKKSLPILISLFLMSVVEFVVYSVYIKPILGPRFGDFLLFTIPVAAAIMFFCITRPGLGHKSILEFIGKKYATSIYIYHIFIGTYLLHYLPRAVLVLVTYICSIAFAYVWENAMRNVCFRDEKRGR